MGQKNIGKSTGSKRIAVVTDVSGTYLTQGDIALLLHPLVQGVILFAHHFTCSAQLIALTRAIRAVKPHLIISVDHEGGRVQRFRKDLFTHLPSLRFFAQLYAREPHTALRLVYQTGWLLATELSEHGIDFSYTPVLDLDAGFNQVIGDRSFGAEPYLVTLLAQTMIHGIQSTGMKVVGKHFPGHGYVTEDSHQTLPVDNRPLSQIKSKDLLPFKDIIKKGAMNAIMPAHILYAAVDPLPAGFSRYWLQQVLRQQLGFSGLIFSDDLSMQAVAAIGTLERATELALGAGVDALLVCQNREYSLSVLKHLDQLEVPPASLAPMLFRPIHHDHLAHSKTEIKKQLAYWQCRLGEPVHNGRKGQTT